MPHVFPMPLSMVYNRLFIEDATFLPSRNDTVTGLGNNNAVISELASPLWRANISSGPINNDEAEALLSLLQVLERPGNDFFVGNPRKRAPRADKTGAILGENVPIISAFNPNNHQVTVSNLPVGYILSEGDVFHFDYGPAEQPRRAYHKFSETVVTNSVGEIINIEVFPHIRAGAVSGTVVTLFDAAMRAKLIPGSFSPSTVGGDHMRITFSAIQKLY